jgi:hypothetical protein
VLPVLGPFTSRVYVTYHFWTPICDVLSYWRHRSVCYISLFTTSLVVITIFLFTMCYDPLALRPWAVLVPLWICCLDLPWSASLIAPLISLLCLSSLCICPFICCPSNRVFAPRKEDTSPHGFISRCCGFQQFGCLGILSRWVATLISGVPCIWEVVA